MSENKDVVKSRGDENEPEPKGPLLGTTPKSKQGGDDPPTGKPSPLLGTKKKSNG